MADSQCLPNLRTLSTSLLRCQVLERVAKSDRSLCHPSGSAWGYARFSKVWSEMTQHGSPSHGPAAWIHSRPLVLITFSYCLVHWFVGLHLSPAASSHCCSALFLDPWPLWPCAVPVKSHWQLENELWLHLFLRYQWICPTWAFIWIIL